MNNIKMVTKYLLLILIFTNTVSCRQSKLKVNYNFNKSLADRLDSILTQDQKYRQMLSSIEDKYGVKSKERADFWKIINTEDSINKFKVISILDKHGWLGQDVVGESGNSALYLVIQHSDLKTQEKYLPMMREAVKNGKALGSNLAYLEDRVALGNGKKQIYGSQLYRNDTTMVFYFAPIVDERNVNKRRASVGLNTIEDRAREFGFEYEIH